MPDNNPITDPKVVALLKALGKAYLENGEPDKAVEKFDLLLSNRLEDNEIILNHALALAATESTSEDALRAYARAATSHSNDEVLITTLATLFLKENVTADPALRVFHKCLSFSPPYEKDVRAALTRLFKESGTPISIAELRQTLLDSKEDPELLQLFLETARRDQKYDDALEVLLELSANSGSSHNHAPAFVEMLLRKKASSEELNHPFNLTPRQARFFLTTFDPAQKLTRVRDLETYLDCRNLLLALPTTAESKNGSAGEYEVLLDQEVEIAATPPTDNGLDSSFKLGRDLFAQILDPSTANVPDSEILRGNGSYPQNSPQNLADFQARAVALFEIINFDSAPDSSSLPFQTFLRIMSGELGGQKIRCLATSDGLIVLATDPRAIMLEATDVLEKLQRYNQVVDESEIIHLAVTVHCTPLSFDQLENEGIGELRKAAKIHNFALANPEAAAANDWHAHRFLVSEQVSSHVREIATRKLGCFRLPYFPQEHFICEVLRNHPVASEAPAASIEAEAPIAVEAETPAPRVSLSPEIQEPQHSHFGKYEVSDTLRSAPTGATYLGYDPQLERQVTIKCYNMEALATRKEMEALRKQFYDEVRKLNRITHPNIGVIYDAGEAAGNFYVVREFIEGDSLGQYLQANDKRKLPDILEIFIGVCRIISHYHQNRIWHKNLKPSNLFVIGAHKEIKLVDAGMLLLPGQDTDDERIALAYSAPEQLNGHVLTEACDCFQLGTLLYESLTNLQPFLADSPALTRSNILNSTPLPVTTLRSDLPAEMNRILKKTLEKNSTSRYASMVHLEQDLMNLFDESEVSTRRRMYEILK